MPTVIAYNEIDDQRTRFGQPQKFCGPLGVTASANSGSAESFRVAC